MFFDEVTNGSIPSGFEEIRYFPKPHSSLFALFNKHKTSIISCFLEDIYVPFDLYISGWSFYLFQTRTKYSFEEIN